MKFTEYSIPSKAAVLIKSAPRHLVWISASLDRCRQQVDDADECLVISISSGPAFGGLENAVERFDPGVIVPRFSSGEDCVPVFCYGV